MAHSQIIRQIESNRKRSAIETTLRAHDPVAKAEARRRQSSLQTGYSYKTFNLIHDLSFGSGCRCCYDPNGDGGDYEMLAAARKEREERELLKGDPGNDSNGGASESKAQDMPNYYTESDNSDDEFDYLLDEEVESAIDHDLQAQRRAELENMARQYEILRYHGYGVHRQMHPQRVFPSVGYRSSDKDRYIPPGAVVHLYDPFSPLSVSLDLYLENVASRYPGTKFVRGIGVASVVFIDDSGETDKWKEGDFPMLLALKSGQVVTSSSGLRDFSKGQNDIEPRLVEQWLERAGVLIDTPPPIEAVCAIRPEEDMLMENMRQLRGLGKVVELDEAERYDCGVSGCNKSFYHEHVGVKNALQEGVLVPESQVVASTESSHDNLSITE